MSAFQALIQSRNPILYWRLNDPPEATVVLDWSGHERDGWVPLDDWYGGDGSLGHPPVFGVEGLLGASEPENTALRSIQSVVGIRAPVALLDPDNSWMQTDEVTWEVFVRVDVVPSGSSLHRILGRRQVTGVAIDWYIGLDSSRRWQFQARANGTNATLTSVASVEVGRTYHLVMTAKAGQYRAYIDGVLIGENSHPGSPLMPSDESGDQEWRHFRIGPAGQSNMTVVDHDITIDEFVWYDYVLTPDEIRGSLSAGFNECEPLPVGPDQPALAADPAARSVRLRSLGYSHPDDVPHLASRWKVFAPGSIFGDDTPLADTGFVCGLQKESVVIGGLEPETEGYVAFFQQMSANGGLSPWSMPVFFNTGAEGGFDSCPTPSEGGFQGCP